VTYLAVLFFVAASGAMLAAAAVIWSHERQRQKEEELIWIGNQFRQAIALYYYRTPGTLKRYPEKLEDLLEDRRYLTTQRYLRKIYRDPVSGEATWGIVAAPSGGVMGVYSLSGAAPIKQNYVEPLLQGKTYQDWKFTFELPL
jgi:hypothetical protein